MNRSKVVYEDLTARGQEAFNTAKLAGVLADYGYSVHPVANDSHGADLLAYRPGEVPLAVQLKGRVTVARKYMGQQLHMAFPVGESFCMIDHDELVTVLDGLGLLDNHSWSRDGLWHRGNPSAALRAALRDYMI